MDGGLLGCHLGDHCLIVLLLVLELLNADHLPGEQVLCADEILLNLGLLGNGRCEVGFCLVEICLERCRVDLEQGFALLHHASFRVVTLDDVTGDVRLDERRDRSLEISNPLLMVGHVLLENRSNGHWNGGMRGWCSGFLFTGRKKSNANS